MFEWSFSYSGMRSSYPNSVKVPMLSSIFPESDPPESSEEPHAVRPTAAARAIAPANTRRWLLRTSVVPLRPRHCARKNFWERSQFGEFRVWSGLRGSVKDFPGALSEVATPLHFDHADRRTSHAGGRRRVRGRFSLDRVACAQ